LILARSFWTGRDVSSAEVHELHESLARLPSPFELPVARKEEPDDADKAFTTSLIHLLSDIEKERCDKVYALLGAVRVRRGVRGVWLG
jgi:hypothetical protein